ncbi:MAG: LytTR family DNA-binding domain-containing protein [Chitinophagaceae bacterium]
MLKALIIDDEQPCVETLRIMLEKKFAEDVQVVAATTAVSEGSALVATHRPDIVFLDIEMPGMSGIEWLQSLSRIDFQVIFTTAHEQYAIKAIKLNALDYLTKPIGLDDLEAAIQKSKRNRSVLDKSEVQLLLEQLKPGGASRKIAIASGTVTHFIPVSEIVRAESQSNYSTVYFINRPRQVITKTLKELEEQLSDPRFLRIHHSHLVNLDHVIGYKNQDSGYLVMQGNEIIEISRRKKQEVLQRLNKL